MDGDALRGRRVLVVEDVAILASALADILVEAGAEVVGPAGTLDAAEKLAAEEPLSAALLDIRLYHEEVWTLARRLDDRGVPFAFVTGQYGRESLPAEWRGRPVLFKPARPQTIVDTVARLEPDGRRWFAAERAT